ncbi:MAG: LysM peptidoglycan-binding domain-containing protein [Desulfobacterales bacterium]
MESGKFRLFATVWGVVAVLAGILLAFPAHAAFFQKRFVVCQDRGRDILCDPYMVQKNDYVTKLFKQRGEIAHEDFPQFLDIFKRINSDVEDVNKIYPNQKILIPLKILAPGAIEGQATGTVTIPIINITNLPDSMIQNSSRYEVQSGDTVSRLIAEQFGKLNRKEYEKVVELFKYMNPDVDDVNLIRVGEKIRLPDPAVRNAGWYDAIFDQTGQIDSKEPFKAPEPEQPPVESEPEPAAAVETPEPKPEPESEPPPAEAVSSAESPESPPKEPEKAPAPPEQKTPDRLHPVYKKAARILNARLMDEGDFFFPRDGLADYRVDLTQNPIMELPDGGRMLFDPYERVDEKAAAAIKKFWRNISIVRLAPKATLRELFQKICPLIDPGGCENKLTFSDNGISVTVRGEYIYERPDGDGKACLTFIRDQSEQMAPAIRSYLASQWVTVEDWINRENRFTRARQAFEQEGEIGKTAATLTATTPSGVVGALAEQLGYTYQENVEISFPYAGFQVNALTNLLALGPNSEVLIDYGDLQGDAIKSIESTGFEVIQIQEGCDSYQIVRQLLSELPVELNDVPLFWAAERRRIHNTSFRLPGTVVSAPGKSGKERKILITDVEVPTEIRYFLSEKGLAVLQVRSP